MIITTNRRFAGWALPLALALFSGALFSGAALPAQASEGADLMVPAPTPMRAPAHAPAPVLVLAPGFMLAPAAAAPAQIITAAAQPAPAAPTAKAQTVKAQTVKSPTVQAARHTTPAPRPIAAGPVWTDASGSWRQVGVASWYGGHRWQGKLTASGVRYDDRQLTAAHASLPIGSRVRVTVADTGRSVVVTIIDRPGTRRRIIDLSRAAALELGILSRGVAQVALTPT